jgi:hypothetical protein
MNIKQRTLVFFCGALFFFAGTAITYAQSVAEQIKPFTTSSVSGADQQPQKNQVAHNPYLDTYLKLQQQIALLNRFVERERSITDMTQNYKRIGLDFKPPKPELTLCRQLPDNLSCALAYPEKYADFLPPPASPSLASLSFEPVTVSDIPQSISELSADFDIDHLLWTDITCLQAQCRAVITPNIENKGARYAIKVGDMLPQGGVVESITAQGVFISRGSKLITVNPAPAHIHNMTARMNKTL